MIYSPRGLILRHGHSPYLSIFGRLQCKVMASLLRLYFRMRQALVGQNNIESSFEVKSADRFVVNVEGPGGSYCRMSFGRSLCWLIKKPFAITCVFFLGHNFNAALLMPASIGVNRSAKQALNHWRYGDWCFDAASYHFSIISACICSIAIVRIDCHKRGMANALALITRTWHY